MWSYARTNERVEDERSHEVEPSVSRRGPPTPTPDWIPIEAPAGDTPPEPTVAGTPHEPTAELDRDPVTVNDAVYDARALPVDPGTLDGETR